jgi:hypothetical protein
MKTSAIIAMLAIAALPAVASGETRTPAPAHAEAQEHIVTSARLTVADVVESAPADARDVELGPSPAPGASRVVSKDEVVRSLRRASISTSFAIPASTRVTRASTHLSSRMLADLARSGITSALPAGVTLGRVDATTDITAPVGTRVGHVTLPKLPKVAGPFRTTVSVELLRDEERVAQLQMAVVLDISEAAAVADVKKGGHVTIIVERETLRVSTEAVLNKDADVGDIVPVTLAATGRVMRVKLLTKTVAELSESTR